MQIKAEIQRYDRYKQRVKEPEQHFSTMGRLRKWFKNTRNPLINATLIIRSIETDVNERAKWNSVVVFRRRTDGSGLRRVRTGWRWSSWRTWASYARWRTPSAWACPSCWRRWVPASAPRWARYRGAAKTFSFTFRAFSRRFYPKETYTYKYIYQKKEQQQYISRVSLSQQKRHQAPRWSGLVERNAEQLPHEDDKALNTQLELPRVAQRKVTRNANNVQKHKTAFKASFVLLSRLHSGVWIIFTCCWTSVIWICATFCLFKDINLC